MHGESDRVAESDRERETHIQCDSDRRDNVRMPESERKRVTYGESDRESNRERVIGRE